MPAMRVQAILKTDSALPEDWVTNSWCFTGTDPFSDATAVNAAIKAFYDDLINTCLSGWIAQNDHQLKWYDLPGVTPNYPVGEFSFNLSSNPSAVTMPHEVAMVMSFQAPRVPGFPQARRRGRLFIGPSAQAVGAADRPSATQITTLATAGGDFLAAIQAIASDVEWAVWSQADQAAVGVANGWVDNSWDTQRRRGVKPTSRTTFT